jgi:hypothetical protein
MELMLLLARITLLMWMAVPRSGSPRHPLNKRC